MTPVFRPLEERFWEKADKSDPGGCWIWTAGTTTNGSYGLIGGERSSGTRLAHRVAYELAVGPIPEGLEIDHLCRVTLCVNPDHLEAVTTQVNSHRSNNFGGINARKTHCIHGHPFDEENTYIWRGRRYCRTCRARREAERARRHRESVC